MKFKHAAIGLACWLASSTSLVAQDTARVLPPLRVLAPAVVSSDSIDDAGALTTIVRQEQVRDLSALDLASALRRTPGVAISRFNPVGAFGGGGGGAVFVRGIGATRPGAELRMFVDGMPLDMTIWNHPLLDLLPVTAMEQVNVHKGPQPHRFGDGFAAIDLATRRPVREGLQTSAELTTGSFGTVVERADAAMQRGGTDVTLSQMFMRSNGHRDGADGRSSSAVLRGAQSLGGNWRMDVTAVFTDARVHDPGRIGEMPVLRQRYDTESRSATLAVSHGVLTSGASTNTTQRWHSLIGSWRVYVSTGDGDWYDQPAPDGNTLTSFARRGIRGAEEFATWPRGRVRVGMDLEEVSGRVRFDRIAPAAASLFDAPTFRTIQPFASVSQDWMLTDDWSVMTTGGARTYVHSQYDGATALHAGLVVRHGNGLLLRAHHSDGVNYPGLETVTLATLIPPLGESWRTLGAERLVQREVGAHIPLDGLSRMLRRTSVDLSAFDQRGRNRYEFGFPPAVAAPSFVNRGRFAVRGVEAALHVGVTDRISFFSGVTFVGTGGDSLPFTPARSLAAGVVWSHRFVRLSADVQGQDEMLATPRSRTITTTAAPVARIPGFSVWHVRAAVPIDFAGRSSEVNLSVENLLDRAYAYQPGYPMPGRWIRAGLRLGN